MRSTTNKGSKLSLKAKPAIGDNSGSNQISVHESRVLNKAAGQAARNNKVGNLQDNLQFIKELHKTKSLKHL